jgi:hypothetical protein
MDSNYLVLTPDGIQNEPDWSRLDWKIAGISDSPLRLSHALPVSDSALFGDPSRGDHALVGVLLLAMQEGREVVVEGRVSPTLLNGLETLQEIWHRWRPKRYRIVRIRAEEESELVPASEQVGAVFLFSGGVDGSFSLFRHLSGQAGRNTRRPRAAVLLHGMDIPLQRPDFFAGAARRAERMLKGTSVDLIRMRTNSRSIEQRWDDSFGLEMSSCLLALQGTYSAAIRGSGEPYDTLHMPWGSTPLTDRLASTAAMEIVHDGCAFNRTEKIEWLAENTQITDQLRVCWAGPQRDRNCGECEKCVRTMLNFWAIGLTPPSNAFSTQLTPDRVRSIRLKNKVQLTELNSLVAFAATRRSDKDPIFRALNSVLRRESFKDYRQTASYLARRAGSVFRGKLRRADS